MKKINNFFAAIVTFSLLLFLPSRHLLPLKKVNLGFLRMRTSL